jgi:hypothetical protein
MESILQHSTKSGIISNMESFNFCLDTHVIHLFYIFSLLLCKQEQYPFFFFLKGFLYGSLYLCHETRFVSTNYVSSIKDNNVTKGYNYISLLLLTLSSWITMSHTCHHQNSMHWTSICI